MRVAYLGPKGTYSEEAAVQRFGNEFEPLFCQSLRSVVESVVEGRADEAVLPVENSTNGPVDAALDALLFCPGVNEIEVCGEVRIAVRHQLYTHASTLSSVTTVYSHPQVWGQVSHWMQKHLPHARRVDCESTAAAVALALAPSKTLDPLTPPVDGMQPRATAAALGGPHTASVEPLVANCADNPTNTTRFLHLRRRQEASAASSGKTTVLAAHGLNLADVIKILASEGLTAQFIVPRPAPGDWEYSYILEVDGPLAGARSAALPFRFLGSHD